MTLILGIQRDRRERSETFAHEKALSPVAVGQWGQPVRVESSTLQPLVLEILLP